MATYQTLMTGDQAFDATEVSATRISDVVKPWAEHAPDQPALVEGSVTWTYRQLASAISDTRASLSALGVMRPRAIES